MRFAPPPVLRIAEKSGGLNQVSVRSYNERLIMSLLLQNERMSRLELGQASGLSAQTISVIVRALERDGFLIRGQAQRGRVGPPTIPMSLNATGAFAVGVSVTAHNVRAVLIDFVGRQRVARVVGCDRPAAEEIIERAAGMAEGLIAEMSKRDRSRLAGIGIALPDDIEDWAADHPMRELEAVVAERTAQEVLIQNNVTAAAAAESMFGHAKSMRDYLFFFVGETTQSRLILNHRVHAGGGDRGRPIVGLNELATLLTARGHDGDAVWRADGDWAPISDISGKWQAQCAEGLRQAIRALDYFVDVTDIVLTGFLPDPVGVALCADLSDSLPNKQICWSEIGAQSDCVGAASLPYASRFII